MAARAKLKWDRSRDKESGKSYKASETGELRTRTISTTRNRNRNNKNDPRNPCTVFIGNVPLSTKKKDILKLVSPFGSVESLRSCGPIDGIRIIKDTRTGINKGFAYVKLKDSSSVLFACKKNERIELEGRKLRVFCCFSDKSKFQTKFGGAKSCLIILQEQALLIMHDHFKVSFNEHDCRQLVKDLRKQLVEVKREKEQITV
ncbi:PREDICTED: transformer-2 protein homolog alpha-like [Amphimedon queenslandica]|uniref:RRM domain-containing protein n=1 Tax=Amphimedon queenslandica TaxID=400682 RepID=A0AAN0JMP2_AMPQE|nr:PREDICTED: transformer-2 protein homolog alpha-like [Amphimedon queenslandica]|eukprot:XP_019858044.1 PREDICTED: transformer-2 protein homolog alpha-like [Amphimedon queenslandica]